LSYQDFEIIDFHVHLPVGWGGGGAGPREEDLNQRYARQRRESWRAQWGFPDPEHNPDADIDYYVERWVEEVEKHGLSRVVLVTGGGNQELARVIKDHGDIFSGFAHHPLADPDVLPKLRMAVEEQGLAGYKLIGPRQDIAFDDPSLESLWQYIEDRELPVNIHFGFLGTGGGVVSHPLIDPLTIFPVAHSHPGIPFVIPHFGSGYWRELLQLCWSCPNVHIDTSGSNQWMDWMPYDLTLKDLFRKAYDTVGPSRIIFGTDSSWFPRGFAHRYLEEQMEVCREIGMSPGDIEMVFSGNARRLLKLT